MVGGIKTLSAGLKYPARIINDLFLKLDHFDVFKRAFDKLFDV